MPKKAIHRRPMPRSLSRGLMAAGVGSAVFAVPLLTATGASAAPVAQSVSHEAAVHQAPKAPAAVKAAAKKAAAPYTVVSGDSLYKIATSHSLSGGWKKLYQVNRDAVGANPNLIHPGLKLTLHGGAARTAAHKATGSEHKATTLKAQNTADSAPAAKAPAAQTSTKQASTTTYSDNLDGWIKQSLAIMAQHGIPGSYDGIYRNIMRESSGNPQAINNWDSNAAQGTPSKGLLQVIDPTFNTYHVAGTSMDPYDPVANITAACNYAAAVYGSIDNVNGPY
ncbi:LysM peptidoglycan-binding domain-containing protein [Streptomyces sp. NRRL F-5126]|uniref:LysM peptidoglycan-binding domain-containing protein n=1 Tax=Streptomyces sp. NRRL F-5126 TaxID=1463857 RepID=UPI0004C99E85|nr:LysM peptidoglycan-binding domain-containing protein [Streptomyces sp. NRRL F-5126]